MNKSEWVWMPHAAHFILGPQCRFHLATYVGDYLVSTVGEMVSKPEVQKIHAQSRDAAWYAQNRERRGDDWEHAYQMRFGFEEIGLDRTYETMVFKAAPGDPKYPCCPWGMADTTDVDFDAYNDAGDAYTGHLAMCEKWATTGTEVMA